MCLRISADVCVAILLTTSPRRTASQEGGLSNANERQYWYQHSLRLWNQDHTVRDHVAVVQNSGDAHRETMPHLEVVSFNHSRALETEHCGRPTTAIGEHELVSLHEGLARATRMANAMHVLKITGRYYIPGLANMLATLTRAHEIIHMHGFAGGCQVMGCRMDACASLWKCPYERFSHCEATIKHRMRARERRFELPVLHTAYTIAGSSAKPVVALP